VEKFVFWPVAVVSLSSAMFMLWTPNAVYSALALVVNFFTLAVMYVLLEAHFLAAVQIIVYAGAIMVLFLFVVMLLNAPHEETEHDLRLHPLMRAGPMGFGVVLAVVLVVELGLALGAGRASAFSAASTSSVRDIGRTLFTDYAFAFEVTSVLILVAMVGAVVLARRGSR